MRVDEATFELIDGDIPGQRFVNVSFAGEGFDYTSTPLIALVGEQVVHDFWVGLDGTSATGTLDVEPPIGAHLMIGYLDQEELLDTGIEYQPV